MEAFQRRQKAALETKPNRRRQRKHAFARGGLDDAQALADRLDLLPGQGAIAGESRQVDKMRRRIEQGCERLFRIGDAVRLELRQPFRRTALARRRAQIEEFSAADGALRRGVTHHEAIALGRRDRMIEHKLHRRLAAGRDWRIAEQHNAGADFRRAMVQARRHPLAHRLRFGREQGAG